MKGPEFGHVFPLHDSCPGAAAETDARLTLAFTDTDCDESTLVLATGADGVIPVTPDAEDGGGWDPLTGAIDLVLTGGAAAVVGGREGSYACGPVSEGAGVGACDWLTDTCPFVSGATTIGDVSAAGVGTSTTGAGVSATGGAAVGGTTTGGDVA